MSEKLKEIAKHGPIDDEKTDKQVQDIIEKINSNIRILADQEAIVEKSINRTSKANQINIGKDSDGNTEITIKAYGKLYKFTITEIT